MASRRRESSFEGAIATLHSCGVFTSPLAIIDVMCFGPPAKASYKRWKKRLDQIMHWGRFDAAQAMTDAEIDEWIRTQRHKVMYRDASRVD